MDALIDIGIKLLRCGCVLLVILIVCGLLGTCISSCDGG